MGLLSSAVGHQLWGALWAAGVRTWALSLRPLDTCSEGTQEGLQSIISVFLTSCVEKRAPEPVMGPSLSHYRLVQKEEEETRRLAGGWGLTSFPTTLWVADGGHILQTRGPRPQR